MENQKLPRMREASSLGTRHLLIKVAAPSVVFGISFLSFGWVVNQRRMAEDSAILQWMCAAGLVWLMLVCLTIVAFSVYVDVLASADAASQPGTSRAPQPFPAPYLPIERFYSGGAVALKPAVDELGRLSAHLGGKPVVLFKSNAAKWDFTAGWLCAPSLGLDLASQITSLCPSPVPKPFKVSIVDAGTDAVAMTFENAVGKWLVLVLDVHRSPFSWAQCMPGRSSPAPAIAKLSVCLEKAHRTLPAPRSAPESDEPDRTFHSVCAICHRLEEEDSWNLLPALSEPAHRGTIFSHTYCPECLSRWYGHIIKRRT